MEEQKDNSPDKAEDSSGVTSPHNPKLFSERTKKLFQRASLIQKRNSSVIQSIQPSSPSSFQRTSSLADAHAVSPMGVDTFASAPAHFSMSRSPDAQPPKRVNKSFIRRELKRDPSQDAGLKLPSLSEKEILDMKRSPVISLASMNKKKKNRERFLTL